MLIILILISMENSEEKLPFWFEEWSKSTLGTKSRPQSWRPFSKSKNDKIQSEKKRAVSTPARYNNLNFNSDLENALISPPNEYEELPFLVRQNSDFSLSSPDLNNSSSENVFSILDEYKKNTQENMRITNSSSNSEDKYTPTILSFNDFDEKNPSRRQSGKTIRPLMNNFYNDNSNSVSKTVETPVFENKLEESWSSLNIFNQNHLGRIFNRLSSLEGSGDKQNDIESFIESSKSLSPLDLKSEDFVIPELPSGIELMLDITSTWGDRHYVGLNGIEIFSISGELVSVAQITADPPDINILPEYSKDPRVVQNLLNNVNRTRDDMHLWLTPFTEGKHHYVKIIFHEVQTIAMIRIWNYNKSRIHSYRGVKDMVITLDGQKIFQGEIARASGGILGGTDAFGDTILFTLDEDILDRVAKHDDSFDSVMNEALEPPPQVLPERPLTADIGDVRPLTCAGPKKLQDISETGGAVLCLNSLTIKIRSTWGLNKVGLTGIQAVGETGEPVLIASIESNPESPEKDIVRLFDGVNETCEKRHMWLTPFNKKYISLKLKFSTPFHISAIAIWNYNESPESSYAGVKNVDIFVDDKLLSEDILVRKAPGHCYYKIQQRVPLIKPLKKKSESVDSIMKSLLNSKVSLSFEEYEPPEMPSGFVFQFQLISTWGDNYYIGLNGIELYDVTGKIINVPDNKISAHPPSVNILDGIDDDVRTPEKLVDGINNTVDGRHMWLAPILPNIVNNVYVIFDSLTTVSMIKIWNYGKTTSRGVKEFGILVDDLLVYNGILEPANPSESSSIPYRTVIFSRDTDFTFQQRKNLIRNNRRSSDSSRSTAISADQSKRPFTSLQMPVDLTSRCKSVMDF